jgi:hypothetical protein
MINRLPIAVRMVIYALVYTTIASSLTYYKTKYLSKDIVTEHFFIGLALAGAMLLLLSRSRMIKKPQDPTK